MHKYFFILTIFSFSIFAQSKSNPEITSQEIFEHIKFLASDELEGRSPGSGKDIVAANYIREVLLKSGITLLGEKGFQHFEVSGGSKISEKSALNFNNADFSFDKDFTPLSISASGDISAEVVFCGYGFVINDPKLKVNDYSTDVKGKWVMVLRAAPEISGMKDLFESHSSLRKKIITAKDNGAAGVIFVNGNDFDKNDNLVNSAQGAGEPDAGIPAIHITRDLAEKILKSSGKTLAQLESALKANISQSVSFNTSLMVKATTIVTRTKKPTVNVIGMIEGSDPVLKNEFIVVGAHFDHLGWGGPGSGSRRADTIAIHNGADDNASGTATALEIVEKLAANKGKMKRSIIFLAFGAEEMGLLGSKYFTENPVKELRNIKLMVNLDMVGRLNAETKVLSVGGTGTAVEFEKYIDKYINASGLQVKKSPEGYGPSDHASFYSKDIPVLFFFTGVHDDYHTPFDDYEKINSEGAKIIGDLAYNIVMDIANTDVPPVFQLAGPKERPKDSPGYKVSLGIMPDMSASDIVGVRAETVIPDRPAHKAGMLKGDIITAINGKPVKDLYEYMERLAELKKGDLVDVTITRGTQSLILKVQL